MSNSPNNTQPRHFSLVRWLIISGMALMLLGIGLKGWRIYRLAQNIRQHAVSAQSMRESRLANISEDQITTLTANLRRDTVALNQNRWRVSDPTLNRVR